MLFACLALVAAAWLGRALIRRCTTGFDDGSVGWDHQDNGLFLRFGRSMTTDVQLMLWVTVSQRHTLLLSAVLRRAAMVWLRSSAEWRFGTCVDEQRTGGDRTNARADHRAFCVAGVWKKQGERESTSGLDVANAWLPLMAAFWTLAIALPWPIVVLSRMSGELTHWYNEMTHGGTVDTYEADPPTVYFALIPLGLLPWAAFFFLWFVLLWREKSESERC